MVTRTRIQFVKSLADKAARRESGLFTVEGRKMVAEALASGEAIESVYTSSDKVAEELVKRGVNAGFETVSAKEMERMSHLKTPSDILAVVRIPQAQPNESDYGKELVLCLDGVQDPGNLGTIIRTADWFGIGRIVCSPDSADCYNPKTVQATMGAIFRVEVRYVPLAGFLAQTAEAGAENYGTFLEGENIYYADLSVGGVVIMGSEGRGVSPEAAAFVNRKLFIPPYPEHRHASESLNVAAAAATVCSEFRRRLFRK